MESFLCEEKQLAGLWSGRITAEADEFRFERAGKPLQQQEQP